MHHLSQFRIIYNTSRKNKNKSSSSKPKKLERINAKKNIDYNLPATSTSNSSSYHVRSSELRDAQSFEVPKSFRIDGSDAGQLEEVYRSLGLQSVEDLGIPIASWEARKIRSSSCLNLEIDRDMVAIERGFEQTVEDFENGEIRVCCDDVEDESKRIGNGIKGVRPPVLSPVHDGCEWDVVRDFGCVEGISDDVENVRVSLDDDEGVGVEDVGMRLERTTLSGSCSFTTSNDDDSSSSTTEPPTSVSPKGFGCTVSSNGRFRNVTITHWQKGALLGRGSFGSVYEGICE